MAIYEFDDEQIMDAVIEATTSPCQCCLVYSRCCNQNSGRQTVTQGGQDCVEMLTGHYSHYFAHYFTNEDDDELR